MKYLHWNFVGCLCILIGRDSRLVYQKFTVFMKYTRYGVTWVFKNGFIFCKLSQFIEAPWLHYWDKQDGIRFEYTNISLLRVWTPICNYIKLRSCGIITHALNCNDDLAKSPSKLKHKQLTVSHTKIRTVITYPCHNHRSETTKYRSIIQTGEAAKFLLYDWDLWEKYCKIPHNSHSRYLGTCIN